MVQIEKVKKKKGTNARITQMRILIDLFLFLLLLM